MADDTADHGPACSRSGRSTGCTGSPAGSVSPPAPPACPYWRRPPPPAPPQCPRAHPSDLAIALAERGAAHGWGANAEGQLALGRASPREAAPVRIAALSHRGVRLLACHGDGGVAETAAGELLTWGWTAVDNPRLLPAAVRAAGVCFPLRSLAATRRRAAAADALGAVWLCDLTRGGGCPTRGALAGQRAVRVVALEARAAHFVALTEGGLLWGHTEGAGWRSISVLFPHLPRGLVPHGGAAAQRAILLQDRSGGKRRLLLFARVAARLRIPADPVRQVLTVQMVHGAYVTGPLSDPFGSPVAQC
eukprot:TRINITY_DN35494_c0_g1_i2.p1 TRINITY_DN35494_c0_g1~~TRINITY_DN35494_c0_g1_i2.p1  ORF type:complete len:306 (+),score=20.03 TRINITY_DN35494_c0_g1_i2:73-990(+)